jgi:hydroxyacylglutathione hydrolase
MSTLGLERRVNPRLQSTQRDEFITRVVRKLPKPAYFEKMEEWNLAGPPPAKGLAGVQALPPKAFNELMTDAVVVDLRSISSFAGLHVPGALSIATDDIPSYLGWFVGTEAPILLVGESDKVVKAVTFMNRQGFDKVRGYLSGGMHEWVVADLPIETTKILTPTELDVLSRQQNELSLIDVRSPEEFVTGALVGAQNIPIKEFNTRISEVSMNTEVVMYCAEGPRSAVTVSAMQRAGHTNISIIRGGLSACRHHGLTIQ